MSYLDSVNSPQDVKKLTTEELEALAGEIRGAILNRDSKVGGHVGPNLGILRVTKLCMTCLTKAIRIRF